ncbi:molybdopterin binding oxidoreductase [Rhodotorula sp. JG-1b]|nr:molybdopterin binding oxidoreductase [Rhodotorula sp. JG-1b]
MIAEDQRVLSRNPLNAEPAPSILVSSFLTKNRDVYHRNHGEFVPLDAATYSLLVSSEVDAVKLNKSNFSLDDVKDFPKRDLVTVLSCAGNRRTEMDHEKEVEGLKWGTSAIANCHFAGALTRSDRTLLADLLAAAGVTENRTPNARDLHIHFESTQDCEDDTYYAASLPLEMALDKARPTLLAYEMNHAALEPAHGFPLRVVVPGVIGARSVKWLERIIIRDHESDNFYQARDYKVLPPEATPETKADYLKQTSPMQEFPLNSVICSPSDGETVEVETGNSASIAVKGYAVQSSEAYKIRVHASILPAEAWTSARLDEGIHTSGALTAEDKHWGWTLFSAEVPLPETVRHLVGLSVDDGVEVALVAYATDAHGRRQELQTQWNLRGVAEASWSVVKCRVKHRSS